MCCTILIANLTNMKKRVFVLGVSKTPQCTNRIENYYAVLGLNGPSGVTLEHNLGIVNSLPLLGGLFESSFQECLTDMMTKNAASRCTQGEF